MVEGVWDYFKFQVLNITGNFDPLGGFATMGHSLETFQVGIRFLPVISETPLKEKKKKDFMLVTVCARQILWLTFLLLCSYDVKGTRCERV